MRWIARLFFLLALAAGLTLAFAYPWLVRDVERHEIGSWRAYTADGGYQPFDLSITPSEAPVRIYVYMTVNGRFQPERGVAVLTLTVAGDGRTPVAKPLDFTQWPPLQDSPQAREAVYRDFAGTIDPVDAERYLVTVGPGEVDGLDIRSIDVLLQAGVFDLDTRIQPIGYTLTAFGFIGLVLSFRRRHENPNSKPPQRWGRG